MDASLIKRALLGTDKMSRHSSELPIEHPIPILSELFRVIQEGDREETWQLLLKAGISSLAERVGYIPRQVNPSTDVEFAKPDKRPPMPSHFSEVLIKLLTIAVHCKPVSGHVISWLLEQVASTGCRFPDGDLPAYFQIFSKLSEYRTGQPLVLSLFGESGQWLARQKQEWNWLNIQTIPTEWSKEKLTELWTDGIFVERCQALEKLRSHNPNLARDLLLESWKSEKVEQREAFLQLFSIGLSDADLPFLESALTDRGQGVRRVAVRHLLHLPQSELTKEMTRQAERILAGNVLPPDAFDTSKNSNRSAIGQSGFILTPPTEWNTEMKKNGLIEKPDDGFARSDWFLFQIVSRIPVTHWEIFFARKPEEIVTMFEKDDSFSALFCAFSNALHEFGGSLDWLHALLNAAIKARKGCSPVPILEAEAHLIRYAASNAPLCLKNLFLNSASCLKQKNIIETVLHVLIQSEPLPWNEQFCIELFPYLINVRSGPEIITQYMPLFPFALRRQIFQAIGQSNYSIRITGVSKEKLREQIVLCNDFDRTLETILNFRKNV